MDISEAHRAQLQALAAKLDTLAAASAKANVRLLVDAEQVRAPLAAGRVCS
jgi:hypothetical protein